MAVKKKVGENLTDANILHVIEQLEKGITKKVACDILRISYNTTRLSRIIEEYNDNVAYKIKRKSQNKGKAATNAEISQIAQDYLSGGNISNIAKSLYRSAGFVKAVIERLGVPQKAKGGDKTTASYLPDQCISETFSPGEKVWSATFHAPAIIDSEIEGDYEDIYTSKAYRMYVLEASTEDKESFVGVAGKAGYYVNSLAYDIGSLKHLEEFKLDWSYI